MPAHLKRAGRISSVWCDAAEFELPNIELVCYFYNPFGPAVLAPIATKLAEHAERGHRTIVLYVDARYAEVFEDTARFKRIRDDPPLTILTREPTHDGPEHKRLQSKPDTLMQVANSMKALLQRTAGPYIWSKTEKGTFERRETDIPFVFGTRRSFFVEQIETPPMLSLFGNWLMHPLSQFLLNLLKLSLHAVPPSLPLDQEVTAPGLAVDEGKPQES
jgi:hypothetical protein